MFFCCAPPELRPAPWCPSRCPAGRPAGHLVSLPVSGTSCPSRCPAGRPADTSCPSRCPCRTCVPPLSRHCPATVPPLSRHCPATVPPLSRHCPATVPPLSRHCPATVPSFLQLLRMVFRTGLLQLTILLGAAGQGLTVLWCVRTPWSFAFAFWNIVEEAFVIFAVSDLLPTDS